MRFQVLVLSLYIYFLYSSEESCLAQPKPTAMILFIGSIHVMSGLHFRKHGSSISCDKPR